MSFSQETPSMVDPKVYFPFIDNNSHLCLDNKVLTELVRRKFCCYKMFSFYDVTKDFLSKSFSQETPSMMYPKVYLDTSWNFTRKFLPLWKVSLPSIDNTPCSCPGNKFPSEVVWHPSYRYKMNSFHDISKEFTCPLPYKWQF